MAFFSSTETDMRAENKGRTKRLPAPIRGLIRNENLALTKAAGAYTLENFFPTSTGIRTRRGTRLYATLAGSTAVNAIMPYQGAGATKLFAANDSGIFDITAPGSPTTPLSAASGIGTSTSGLYSHVQFATSGGEFLFCVNGTNKHKVFDGTSWAEDSPAVTGTTTDNWSQVWSYNNRIFGVKKNTLTALYLSAASIGGAATALPLGGVFKLGGTLLFGATWSVDSGEGLDDVCVFVSSKGEVAAYIGSDPASWTLQGLYKIGVPLGKNAWFKAGGDLVIATDEGLVPMSAAVSLDQAALKSKAASFPIEELWLQQSAARAAVAWQCATWPQKQMAIISTPTYGGLSAQVFVANTRTGAWAVFTGGYDCRGLAPFGSSFYFGSSGPTVYEAESGASDNGTAYVCKVGGLFEDLGAAARQKIIKLMRGIFRSAYQTINPKLSVSTDGDTSFPTAPASAAEPSSGAVFGSGVWGSSVFGGTNSSYQSREWQTVEGVGESISFQCQVTLSNTSPPDIELAAVDIVYETGEPVA